jgi:2-hydroxyacyl-CoA lyase 1
MGVGVGYAIAAAFAQDHKVVCIQGDSAFGFSGMEIEVACRYSLPITFIVINNNGIYRGLDTLPQAVAGSTSRIARACAIPATSLLPEARYEQMIEAFGGRGFFVRSPSELREALQAAAQETQRPTLINVMIRTDTPTPAIVQSGGH